MNEQKNDVIKQADLLKIVPLKNYIFLFLFVIIWLYFLKHTIIGFFINLGLLMLTAYKAVITIMPWYSLRNNKKAFKKIKIEFIVLFILTLVSLSLMTIWFFDQAMQYYNIE